MKCVARRCLSASNCPCRYGFQPVAFVEMWRRMYTTIKRIAPKTIIVWAPNEGFGYVLGAFLNPAHDRSATHIRKHVRQVRGAIVTTDLARRGQRNRSCSSGHDGRWSNQRPGRPVQSFLCVLLLAERLLKPCADPVRLSRSLATPHLH
jgi:hypothetical protein